MGSTVPSATQMAGRIAALRDAFLGTATGWPSPDDGDARDSRRSQAANRALEQASRHPEWTHRALNVGVAGVSMVVLAPFAGLIAVLIKQIGRASWRERV